MKYITTLALTLSLAGLTATVPITASATTYDTTASPWMTSQVVKARPLFIIRAHYAVISEVQGIDKLTLSGLDNNVILYSNRPFREGGQIALSTFMNDWSQGTNSFKKVLPKAIFLYQIPSVNNNGLTKGDTLELSNPAANANDSWTFDVKSVDGQVSLGKYHLAMLLVDMWDPNNTNQG